MEYNVLDTLHRGYVAYQTETENDNTHRKLLQVILNTDPEDERCDTLLRTCDIHTDWIEEIEKAIPFIERAISENRQFILRQGEIVPIEKVRRVSKTSVEHLARHSEMITREPAPGEDLIPDKILMTENVGTYAVYENRFLYMLLCYIKDFVQIKYAKIADLSHSFTAETILNKNFAAPGQKISFSLHFKENATGVTIPEHTKKTADCLQRMRNLLLTADALLKTSLMIEVSTAPMLKPPITRTNVLLHNPCFVAAIDLYDYLAAYEGDGYTARDLHLHTGTLAPETRRDYAELITMTSYLAYRQGGILDKLEARYQEADEIRMEEERNAANARLAELKANLTDLSPEAAAYILALEQKNERDNAEFEKLAHIRELARTAERQLAEAEEIRQSATDELAKKSEELRLIKLQSQRIDEVHQEKMNEMNQLLQQRDAEAKQLTAEHADAIEALNTQFCAEYAQLAEQYHLQAARLHALQQQKRLPPSPDAEEDFTSKEGFALLEAEYSAFKRFYDAQWKLAKARIRREKLAKPSEKASASITAKEADEQ